MKSEKYIEKARDIVEIISKEMEGTGELSATIASAGMEIDWSDEPDSLRGASEVTAYDMMVNSPQMYFVLLEVFEASKYRRPVKKATFEAVCEVLWKVDGKYR